MYPAAGFISGIRAIGPLIVALVIIVILVRCVVMTYSVVYCPSAMVTSMLCGLTTCQVTRSSLPTTTLKEFIESETRVDQDTLAAHQRAGAVTRDTVPHALREAESVMMCIHTPG